MRQISYALFFITLISFTCFIGCGGSKEAAYPETSSDDMMSDTSEMAALPDIPDSLRVADTSSIAAAIFGELDSVKITTDERINPVMALQNGTISNAGLQLEKVTEPGLSCEYYLPKSWIASRKEYKNLVNYINGNGVSVTVSVAKPAFDSLNLWAQVEEALSFGKNQIPKHYQRFNSAAEQTMKCSQTYIGRYEFGGKQYNNAFYRFGDYQFNIITFHPVDSLAAEDVQALNYLFSTFKAAEPKVEIPKPVSISSESPIESATKTKETK